MTHSVRFGKLAYTMTSEHNEQTNISITVIVANLVVKTPSGPNFEPEKLQ